jgi:hypothetical protein
VRWPSVILLLMLASSASSTTRLYSFQKGRPVELSLPALATDVRDPIFALLAALLDAGAYGSLAPATIDSVARAAGGSRLPYGHLLSMERDPQAVDRSILRMRFDGDLKLSVPYSILGYNPGSLRSSRDVQLQHWKLPTFALRWQEGDEWRELRLRDIELFALREGSVRLDVDWWVDKLFGSGLDDTDLVGFAIIHHEERRQVVAFGYNGSGKGRSGVFDLTQDEVRFPAPKELLRLGRELRARAESLLAESGDTRR